MYYKGGHRKHHYHKASGGDGISAELFKILKDDAVKVLHSICQQIWKTQQWPQDWKRSVFIPVPKKGNAKVAQTTAQLHSSHTTWLCNCAVIWAFFGITFHGTGMKTDLFQSCGHCWIFQICWHIKCSTLTASSFRISNSSTGIPSLPFAMIIVMLSQVHFTSHSRISGSRWVTTPSLLSRSLRHILYNFFGVFLPPLLNFFCFCYILSIFVLKLNIYWAWLWHKSRTPFSP